MQRGKQAAVWLGILLLFLAANYRLQQLYFRSTGDVVLYQHYAQRLLAQPDQLPQEYPPLTVLIFLLPQLLIPNAYLIGFALCTSVVSWLLVVLVDRLRPQGSWLLGYMLLSGLATLLFRFDSWVVLLTVLGFWLAQRKAWSTAQVVLAIAVALKLYPILLMPIVALWAWHDQGWRALRSAGLGLACVIASFAVIYWWAPNQLTSMLSYHRERPLQTESVGATIAWLLGPIGSNWSFGSANITSAASPLIMQALTFLSGLLVIMIYGLFWQRRLAPAAACALVLLGAIATSKVFSTQYVLWALPFVVLAGERRWLWLLISGTTLLVYPVGFLFFADYIGQPVVPWWFALIVALRNSLWVLACILGAWDWTRHDQQVGRQSRGPAQLNVALAPKQ